jgi:hypothetical protein
VRDYLRPTAAALVLLVVSGCATRAERPVDRGAVLLTHAPAPREDCVVLDRPATLPTAGDLVDVASLRDEVRALRARKSDTVPGYVLLSMRYEPEGLNVRRDVIEHSVSPVLADSIQRLVFEAIREQPEREEELQVRLRLDVNGVVELRTGRSEYCPPWPRDPQVEASLYGVQGTGVRYRRGARERVVIVRLAVHPNGYVTGGQFIRGAPSGGALEQDVLRFLRQYSFHPARLDGIPVHGTIDLPVRVPA